MFRLLGPGLMIASQVRRRRLITPGVNSGIFTACSFFPFGFRGQTFSLPFTIIIGRLPGDVVDRIVFESGPGLEFSVIYQSAKLIIRVVFFNVILGI